ncbi:unnamed protein product, partial [marine sediment metagenome]
TWATKAQVITKRPCLLKNVIMTPSKPDGSIWLYDGESDKDPPIGHVFTSIRVTREYSIIGGLETHRGLYIGNFDHIEGVLIHWEPLGEGKA